LAALPIVRRLLKLTGPHRLYKDGSEASLATSAAAARRHVRKSKRTGFCLPILEHVAVFDDVEPCLAGLGQWVRLAVLTNCEQDLFAHNQRTFR